MSDCDIAKMDVLLSQPFPDRHDHLDIILRRLARKTMDSSLMQDRVSNRISYLIQGGPISYELKRAAGLTAAQTYRAMERLVREKRAAKDSRPGGYCRYWPLNPDGSPYLGEPEPTVTLP